MKHLLSAILALLVLSAFAQRADTLRQIDQLFAPYHNATPGVSVAVERDGKLIYHKAFGLADLEHGVPNTTTTIFEAGSVSKQFTAAAILLLATEGKLSLDDDVRKYIPELPAYDKPITIRHCMNHTSGLKDWGSVGALSGWPRTTRVYTLDLALQIICRQKSLNFSPGSEYSYSNSGYTLMVVIIERITKMTLAEFTRTRLFEPAGMKHTQWRDNFRQVIPGRAVAYRWRSGVYEEEMPFEHIHGHGGLLTTTEDLIRWNHQLENPTIGGAGMINLREQQGILTNGQTISYAGGLFVNSHNGFREVSHTGATAGYRAYLGWFPKKKLAIALLSNDGTFNPGGIGSQIADIFLGKQPSPPLLNRPGIDVPETVLKRYEGIYRSVRNFDTFTLTVKDGKVWSNKKALTVLHPDTLYLDRLYWIMKKNGQILLRSSGDTGTYVKVRKPEDASLPGSSTQASPYLKYLETLVGVYHSEEADATYRAEVRDGALWLNMVPPGPWKLEPVFYDGFTADGDLYEFKRNKKEQVLALEVSIGRAERIVFRKQP